MFLALSHCIEIFVAGGSAGFEKKNSLVDAGTSSSEAIQAYEAKNMHLSNGRRTMSKSELFNGSERCNGWTLLYLKMIILCSCEWTAHCAQEA